MTPFDNDNDEEVPSPARKIGLKKENKPSSSDNTDKQKSAFESKADGTFKKMEDYKSQIWELSVKFRSFIESKVLPENKGPIASNLEKEVVDKLVALATEMNQDDSQQEGIGNTALCVLLMKCMLLQRDTINTINFKLEQLDKKFNILEKDIKK